MQIAGVTSKRSYLRTSDGYEVDLILELGRTRWAIEVKLTSNPAPQDLERLNRAADLVNADRRLLISQVGISAIGERSASANLRDALALLTGEA